jgi:AraC-like DNA-binding protein
MILREFTENVPLQDRAQKSPHLNKLIRLKLTAMARNGVTARQYMPAILNLITAEAQYSALMYFHRRAGNIEHVPNRILTLQDRVTIFNMRQNGVKIPDIAKEIGASAGNVYRICQQELGKLPHKLPKGVQYTRRRLDENDAVEIWNLRSDGSKISDIAKRIKSSKSNVSRVLLKMGFEGRSHVPLTRDEISTIRQMRLSGASLRDIAEKMGRPHSTIKYQVDRLNLVS